MNTAFENKDSHKYTLTASNPGSAINYVIHIKKLDDMVLDTRVYRGPEIHSDPYLPAIGFSAPFSWC
jgi:hypothetical protein